MASVHAADCVAGTVLLREVDAVGVFLPIEMGNDHVVLCRLVAILDEQATEVEVGVCRCHHIGRHLDVTIEFMPRELAADIVDLSKLPEDASETLRIVRVGDYDACACIGAHVKNTAEIGTFKILSHDYENGRWRVRWKVQ